jgi:hypothetical protein
MRCMFITMLLSISNIIIGQIPNNSFENWSVVNSYPIPDNWDNLNSVTYSSGIFTCLQGNPNNPGSMYLYLISKNIPGKGVVPGKVVSGKIDTITFEPINGFAYTNRPLQLSYSMQYMPYDPTDSVNVSVLLTNWNSGNSKRDTVAYGANYYNAMAHEWIPGSTYLNYVSNTIPDSAIIVISSSSKIPKEGSYIYIDNLQFDGTVSEIGEQTLPKCSIYPNPTNGIVNINIADNSIFTVTVFNSMGLQMYSRQVAGNFQIETSSFPSGIYFLQIQSQHRFTTKKIIKS